MGKFRIEIRPWLSTLLDPKETGPIIIEKVIAEAVTLGDVLKKLAAEYQAFGTVFFDPYTHYPSNSVAIVINGKIMQSLKELDANMKDGDAVTLLPFLDGG
jgi:molybdopterin converting factor small subunit